MGDENIHAKYDKEVWDKTIETPEFLQLSNKVQKALDEYHKSSNEPLEINIKLKNNYLGYLY